MKIRYLAAVLLLAAASAAHAFDRPFPENVRRGTMALKLYPSVTIDGKPFRLSPGARIWNQDNLIQMPNSLGAGPYLVNYTQNPDGDVDRVWILTPDEAARRLPAARNAD